MACCAGKQIWFIRLTAFFFFGALAIFIPILTPHLDRLGFNLRGISAIHLMCAVSSALGLLLAALSTRHRGHRICLVIALVLAALSSAGLDWLPALEGRARGDKGRPPVAEILCSEEGSVLFFRQCGSSCDLNGAGRLDLQISDCRFEPKTDLYLHWKQMSEQFNFLAANPGTDEEQSEPERGDLPEKSLPGEKDVPVSSPPTEQHNTDDQYFYDYDANHNQVKDNQQVSSKKTEPIVQRENTDYEYDDIQDSESVRTKREAQNLNQEYSFDPENEEIEIQSHFQPHLCYETGPQSKLCHVFTTGDHTFRVESVFRRGISRDSRCFYPLIHSDNENQLLSEVQCRLHRNDYQVRCKAEGMELRARVSHNGSDICTEDSNKIHFTFWLYLLLRTLAEIGVIAALILLFMVSLDCQQRELQAENPKSPSAGYFWLWAAFGAAIHGPLAGVLHVYLGMSTVFIAGSVAFGLAALMALCIPRQYEHEVDEDLQDQFQEAQQPLEIQNFWICRRMIGKIIANKQTVSILGVTILFGTGVAHVHINFYWYLMVVRQSYLLPGISMIFAVIFAGIIFPARNWLYVKCGHHYIFMIGLLLYSIRFFGYALIKWDVVLIILELLEPFCSCWMLITALIAISTMVSSQRHNLRWKVNAWALIVVFHCSIGRGLGSLYSGLSSYYFGVKNVFVGTAIIFVLVVSLWLLLYLTVAKSQRKYVVNKENGKTAKTNGDNRQDKQQTEPVYTQLESQKTAKKNLKN